MQTDERHSFLPIPVIGTVIFLAVLVLSYFTRDLLLMSLIGLGFGVLLSPVLTFFRTRFRLPRVLGSLVFLIGLLMFLGLLGYGVFALAADQAQRLAQRAPEYIDNLRAMALTLSERYPDIEQQVRDFDFAGTFQTVTGRVFTGLRTGVALFAGLVFAFVIGIYTAINATPYYQSLIQAFPAHRRSRAAHILGQCARILRLWFRAQLVDMVIMGTLTAVGLWIIGIDYWAVFGLLTVVFGLIPYVGILLVVIIASLIVLASEPAKLPWVLGFFFITQQIEGNVILPLVMRGQVKLPEVPLLIFVLVMGSWFGLLGVFVGTPIFAVMHTLYTQLYLPKMEKARPQKGTGVV